MKKKITITEIDPGMIKKPASLSLILENGDQLISEQKKPSNKLLN